MATTNGTRAIIAAQSAPVVLAGSLVNAQAVARLVARAGRSVSLLCAGTVGQFSMEDLLGCGAVLHHLQGMADLQLADDLPRMALRLFRAAMTNLPEWLADAQGGRNVTAAGLPDDLTFVSALDSLQAVGQVFPSPLCLRNSTI
jgi:2-phosphosulfolactate phosphatase